MRDYRDVGGTSGGLASFIFGLALACTGGYLLLQHVIVTSGYWRFGAFGAQASFGLTVIPALLGVALLFYDGRSVLGWLLFAGGLVIIVAGILLNLGIYFQPTSLFNTLLMLFMLVGGTALIVKALFPHRRAAR